MDLFRWRQLARGVWEEGRAEEGEVIVLEQWAAKIRTYHRIAGSDEEGRRKSWDEFVLNYP